MRHLSEGTLRRLRDDRFAASNREREHVAGCERCRRRAQIVDTDADRAARLFAGAVVDGGAVEPALARIRQRIESGAHDRGAPATPPVAARRRLVLALIAVPAVVAGLVVSANAAGWLSIFSPTQVAPITVTAGELRGLPDLSAYGRMHVTDLEPQQVAGPAQAAAMTGLRVLQPGSIPADVPSTARWEVVQRGTATFTLDAAAAAASATREHRTAPRIPASLDGTSVTVDAGPAVFAVYGSTPAGAGAASDAAPPTLVIAEGVRPTASTNGASLQQLEDFLLAQPGISPQLAAEIRAIGAPASTLPIPVISGLMTSRTVTIEGVQGVLTGDSTGLGSALIWERGGVVYAVGGLLPESEVLSIAASLH